MQVGDRATEVGAVGEHAERRSTAGGVGLRRGRRIEIGGEIARAWDLIESALTETIANSVRRGLPSARILPSTLGEKPTLRGALSLVLASKFAAAFAA